MRSQSKSFYETFMFSRSPGFPRFADDIRLPSAGQHVSRLCHNWHSAETGCSRDGTPDVRLCGKPRISLTGNSERSGGTSPQRARRVTCDAKIPNFAECAPSWKLWAALEHRTPVLAGRHGSREWLLDYYSRQRARMPSAQRTSGRLWVAGGGHRPNCLERRTFESGYPAWHNCAVLRPLSGHRRNLQISHRYLDLKP